MACGASGNNLSECLDGCDSNCSGFLSTLGCYMSCYAQFFPSREVSVPYPEPTEEEGQAALAANGGDFRAAAASLGYNFPNGDN